jgi:hypothetical protein
MLADDIRKVAYLHLWLFARDVSKGLPVSLGQDRIIVRKLDMDPNVLRTERDTENRWHQRSSPGPFARHTSRLCI